MPRRTFAGVAVTGFALCCLLGSAQAADSPPRCSPGREKALSVQLSPAPNVEADLYAVPAGTTFVVTDIVALRDGNADGLLRMLAGEQLVAVVPLVGIVSHTDLYGIHLVTGIPFPGGQSVRVRKADRGAAWVTLVGYEVSSP